MSFLIFKKEKLTTRIVERSPRYYSVDAGHRVSQPNVRTHQLELPDRKGCIQGLRSRRDTKDFRRRELTRIKRYTTYWGWQNGKGVAATSERVR